MNIRVTDVICEIDMFENPINAYKKEMRLGQFY